MTGLAVIYRGRMPARVGPFVGAAGRVAGAGAVGAGCEGE